MKLASQMPSSTSLVPSFWPARTVEMLILFRCRQRRPRRQLATYQAGLLDARQEANLNDGSGNRSAICFAQKRFSGVDCSMSAVTETEMDCLLPCAYMHAYTYIYVVTISKEVPLRILTLAILVTAMTSVAGQARAQTYDPAFPVCMHLVPIGGGGYEDCSYFTMAQCAMSASGRAGQCNMNPYYAGAAASLRRNGRRHRRGY